MTIIRYADSPSVAVAKKINNVTVSDKTVKKFEAILANSVKNLENRPLTLERVNIFKTDAFTTLDFIRHCKAAVVAAKLEAVWVRHIGRELDKLDNLEWHPETNSTNAKASKNISNTFRSPPTEREVKTAPTKSYSTETKVIKTDPIYKKIVNDMLNKFRPSTSEGVDNRAAELLYSLIETYGGFSSMGSAAFIDCLIDIERYGEKKGLRIENPSSFYQTVLEHIVGTIFDGKPLTAEALHKLSDPKHWTDRSPIDLEDAMSILTEYSENRL